EDDGEKGQGHGGGELLKAGPAGSPGTMAVVYGLGRRQEVDTGSEGCQSSRVFAVVEVDMEKHSRALPSGRGKVVSMTQTFIDTLIMATFTALTLIVTDAYLQEGLRGAAMTAWAIEQGLGNNWGIYSVTIAVVVYAFTTIVGWCYYGERCAESLLGRRAIFHYRLVFTLVVLVGALTTLDMVWTFSDIANGLMALPNLIGLLVLSGVVVSETRTYFSRPDWRDAAD
ncbi:MAG TPA: alanine:cation symporter family protein, partial [Pseudomonadaceae bacterium]|nr:alanine:cation symporter family protein [Pseudomonadaceae bacterium]